MLESSTTATGVSLVRRALQVPKLSWSAASCALLFLKEGSEELERREEGGLLVTCLDSA